MDQVQEEMAWQMAGMFVDEITSITSPGSKNSSKNARGGIGSSSSIGDDSSPVTRSSSSSYPAAANSHREEEEEDDASSVKDAASISST